MNINETVYICIPVCIVVYDRGSSRQKDDEINYSVLTSYGVVLRRFVDNQKSMYNLLIKECVKKHFFLTSYGADSL